MAKIPCANAKGIWKYGPAGENGCEFDLNIEASIGPSATEAHFVDKFKEFQTPTFEPYEDEDTKPTIIPDHDNFDTFDQYKWAEVLLQHRSEMLTGKVCEQKQNNEGSLKGTPHETTMFDIWAYVIEFPIMELKQNTIEERVQLVRSIHRHISQQLTRTINIAYLLTIL